MSERALSDLRVLDLTHHIAGPYCTKLLADFGAEVLKIEKPNGGDPARRAGPFLNDVPHPEKSGLFLHLNTNKKSVTLNLKTATGRKILLDLVRDADILVENFEPRVMSSLGLDYETLEKVNPRLVMTSISNFGQTGPYRDYKMQEIVAYAVGGLMYITGDHHREPLKTAGSQAQYHAGMNGYVGTMGAVQYARTSGVGQQVDVCLMESIASILEYTTGMYSYMGVIRKRWYSRHIFQFPADIFPCKDGYIVVLPAGQHLAGLAKLMDLPEIAEDERFFRPFGHIEYAEEISEMMMPWLSEHKRFEIFYKAQEMDMPFALVQTTADLFEEPQLKDRHFFVELDHPEAGKLKYTGAPFIMTETPMEAGRAPLLGEHNVEVLCGKLGYSKEDLGRLRHSGVI